MKDETSYIAWQGQSWRLRVDAWRLPDGSREERGIIEHPGAVALIPLQEAGRQPVILMIRQYRLAIGDAILELPAGTRKWDESWLDCAQRELREETGYRAESFLQLGEIWPAPGLSSEVVRIYLALRLSHDPLPADVDEQIEVQPFALADLVAMANDGRIQDAKSIIGILKAATYLGG